MRSVLAWETLSGGSKAEHQDVASLISLGNLTIDQATYRVLVDDEGVGLTYLEYELLFLLARNAGKVLSRRRLERALWPEASSDKRRNLIVEVSRLRKKIASSYPWATRTIVDRGYTLFNTGPAPEPSQHSSTA